MKNVLVCCGTSMITSAVVVKRIKDALEKEKIQAMVHTCKYSDVPTMMSSTKYDLIVPTGPISDSTTKDIPVVLGTPFLTGVGMEEVMKKIISILKA